VIRSAENQGQTYTTSKGDSLGMLPRRDSWPGADRSQTPDVKWGTAVLLPHLFLPEESGMGSGLG